MKGKKEETSHKCMRTCVYTLTLNSLHMHFQALMDAERLLKAILGMCTAWLATQYIHIPRTEGSTDAFFDATERDRCFMMFHWI